MKDLENQVQKALSVINLVITFFCVTNCYTQKYDNDFISNEEYDVINSVFTNNNSYKANFYDTTDFDKDLIIYFEDEDLSLITRKVGIPVTISDKELKDILTSEIRSKIISKIYLSKPLKLNFRKLNRVIFPKKSYDTPQDLSNNVYRIMEPIIIDDVAIFRKIGRNESSVYILKKENKKWNIKYTFNDWQILE